MNDWKKYRKPATQEMRDYTQSEDLTDISVAPGETPKVGGKIARDNQGSFWYVSPEFMEENYVLAGEKQKIVTLCGSSKFCDIMAVCAWLIERDEKAIAIGLHLLPQWYHDLPDHHLAEHEGVAEEMDNLHLRKIDISDEIFVVNYNDYIGESTAREIKHAQDNGVHIRFFTHDGIGPKVQKMLDDFQIRLKKRYQDVEKSE